MSDSLSTQNICISLHYPIPSKITRCGKCPKPATRQVVQQQQQKLHTDPRRERNQNTDLLDFLFFFVRWAFEREERGEDVGATFRDALRR